MSELPTENKITLDAGDAGQRLDQFVAASISTLSRTEVQRMLKAEQILVNGSLEKASYRLEPDDIVEVSLPEPVSEDVLPEDIPLDILFEDEDLAVINKPAGMVVHPAHGNLQGTLVNAALAHWPQMRQVGEVGRSGIVHRLDKDTSGLLVMAKTPQALEALQAQFKERTAYKRYVALVEGVPGSSRGVIDAPIGRDPKQRKRMAVQRDGRPAETGYEILEDLQTHSLLSLELHTGRTHQIRVHLAWLGNPVVGDRVYGFRKQRIKLKRLFLHSAELHIDSPSTGERLKFNAPLPVGLEDVLAKLRRNMGAH